MSSSHEEKAALLVQQPLANVIPPSLPPCRPSSSGNVVMLNKKKDATVEGPPEEPVPSSSSIDELRRQVYRAFCEIPNSNKAAYVDAMSKNPELVLKESDPVRFLRREAGDAHAAACLLAAYWEKRLSLFGDRSLLPMNLTGNGALSQSDIAVLKGGSQVFLPSDSQGRTVLYVDDSRDGKSESAQEAEDVNDAKYRCAFALYTQAAQEEKPIVVVRLFPPTPVVDPTDTCTDNNPKKKKASQVCDMFEYMPAKLDSMFCLSASRTNGTSPPPPPPPPADVAQTSATSKLPFFQKPVKDTVNSLDDYRGKKGVGVLHNVCSETPEETLVHMQKYGFCKEGLPFSAGGTWAYSNHESWVDRRQARELMEERVGREKAAALHAFAKMAAMANGNKKRRAGTAALDHHNKAKASSTSSKKAKVQVVPNMGDPLPAIARLAAATSTARTMKRKDRKRRLDVVYSRNRRMREKEEEAHLQAHCAQLKRTNAFLKRKEKRMVHFLLEAQKEVDNFKASEASDESSATFSSASLPAASATSESTLDKGVSAGDLQAILQLLTQQRPEPPKSAPAPPPPSANGTEVLAPIMQRMLSGKQLGNEDILSMIMLLMGYLQKPNTNSTAQRQVTPSPPPPPSSPPGLESCLLQVLGSMMKEDQSQTHQRQQHQTNLVTNLLPQLQSLVAPATQHAPPVKQGTSNFQPPFSSQDALLQLLLQQNLAPAQASAPSCPPSRPLPPTRSDPYSSNNHQDLLRELQGFLPSVVAPQQPQTSAAPRAPSHNHNCRDINLRSQPVSSTTQQSSNLDFLQLMLSLAGNNNNNNNQR